MISKENIESLLSKLSKSGKPEIVSDSLEIYANFLLEEPYLASFATILGAGEMNKDPSHLVITVLAFAHHMRKQQDISEQLKRGLK